jgi:hypothetical protein
MAFSRIWNYFVVSFDDSREGLIDFMATSVNFFTGVEFSLNCKS